MVDLGTILGTLVFACLTLILLHTLPNRTRTIMAFIAGALAAVLIYFSLTICLRPNPRPEQLFSYVLKPRPKSIEIVKSWSYFGPWGDPNFWIHFRADSNTVATILDLHSFRPVDSFAIEDANSYEKHCYLPGTLTSWATNCGFDLKTSMLLSAGSSNRVDSAIWIAEDGTQAVFRLPGHW